MKLSDGSDFRWEDTVKTVVNAPVNRDVIELYVIRYRRAVVAYVGTDRVREDYTTECLVLEDGVPHWIAIPTGGMGRPFAEIDGMALHQQREARLT